MAKEDALEGKVILVVDDEPDILETVSETLDMCIVHKAKDFDTGLQYILNYLYDAVILDIMGVNGFELLKASVSRGFPSIILTAHAVTPEALKKSMKLGAISFLPKEKTSELRGFLAEAVFGGRKPSWIRFFDSLGSYLNRRFGPDWKEKDRFFKEFEESVRESEQKAGA